MSYLKRVNEVLAWGNNWYFQEPTDPDKKEDHTDEWTKEPLQSIKRPLGKFAKTGKLYDEDANYARWGDDEGDSERKAMMVESPNSAAVEEAHKKAATKSRKRSDRYIAIKKIQDQKFLKDMVLDSSVHEDLRSAAATRIKDEKDIEDLFLKRVEGDSSFPVSTLVDFLKNEAFIIKNFDKIKKADALLHVNDEKLLTELLLANADLREHSSDVRRILDKINDQKLISKLALDTKNGDDQQYREFLAVKSDDKKALEHLAELKIERDPARHYYHSEPVNHAASVALFKLKDKNLAKKALDDSNTTYLEKQVALSVLEDENEFKKVVTDAVKDARRKKAARDNDSGNDEDENIDDAGIEFDDEDNLDMPSFKTGYNHYRGGERNELVNFALSNIKDQDFLKKVLPTSPDFWDLVKDQKWKEEIFKTKKAEDGSAPVEYLSKVGDEKFIMKEIIDALKRGSSRWIIDAIKEVHDQPFLKILYGKMDPKKEGSSLRKVIVENITDSEFLLKIYKSDKSTDVREAAFKHLEDPEALFKMLMKERSKSNRHTLIWKLRKNPEWIAKYLAEDFDDSDTHSYGTGKLDAATAKKILSGDIKGPHISSLDMKKFTEIFKDDQPTLIKMHNRNDRFSGSAVDYITDEDFIMENVGAENMAWEIVEKLKKPANIAKIAIENRDSTVAMRAFHNLKNPPIEIYNEIAVKAKAADVRKAAVPYVTDDKVLKNILLFDKDIGTVVLPHFKGDLKTLQEALLKAKDPGVLKALAGRIKDDATLKAFVLKATNPEVGSLALKRVKDKEFLKTVAEKGVEPTLVRTALTTLAEDEGNKAFLRTIYFERDWQPIFDKSGWRSPFGPENLNTLIAPFLNADDMKSIVMNPSLLNNFPPEKLDLDEKIAAEALSQKPEIVKGYNNNQLQVLFDLAPEKAKAFFSMSLEKMLLYPSILFVAVLHLEPEDLNEENISSVYDCIKKSPLQNRIPQKIIDKSYELGDEVQKAALANRASEGVLTPEHKDKIGRERFKYRSPTNRNKHNLPTKIKEAVKHPKEELLRLLVQLAR